MGGGEKCRSISLSPETATHTYTLHKTYFNPSQTSSRSSNLAITEQLDDFKADFKADSLPSLKSSSEAERHSKIFTAVMKSHCSRREHSRLALEKEKLAILRHRPGDWSEKVAGLTTKNYDIPETTTLFLIGPLGSGKSSLVNRITRVFEETPLGIDRALVSHPRVGEGTCFLQEYPIPRNSETLCVYDTRSLSMVPSDNFHLLKQWMTNGVTHGKMVFQNSDDAIENNKLKIKAKKFYGYSCKKRPVNFVILVVNGVSILESMLNKETQHNDLIVQTFNYPYLAFRDCKPAVVMTHGDELSLHDRIFVRAKLGELLGISACVQIFDVPDNDDYATEVAIVDLLRFCIHHSDQNLPLKWMISIEAQKILNIISSILQDLNEFGVLILFISCFVSIYALSRLIMNGSFLPSSSR